MGLHKGQVPKGKGVGVKGRSGRKTAKVEYAKKLDETILMYSPQDIKIIKEKIRAEKPVSIREIMLLKEAGGNERLIAQHYGKVVPDSAKLDITSGGKRIGLFDYTKIKSNVENRADNGNPENTEP